MTPNIASRNTDPHSSHLAESDITTSGERQHQNEIALDVVTLFPGLTSKELAQHCPLDRYQLARRLNDLFLHNRVKKVEIGTNELKWYIAEKAPVSPVEPAEKKTDYNSMEYKELVNRYKLLGTNGRIEMLCILQRKYPENGIQYKRISEQVERLKCKC